MTSGLRLERVASSEWILPREGTMRVPGRIYADTETIAQLEAEGPGPCSWTVPEDASQGLYFVRIAFEGAVLPLVVKEQP